MLIERLEVGSYAANCYIVGDEAGKDAMIIDPGAEAARILKRVKALGVDVKLIVATHAHSDHIEGINEVKQAIKAPLAIHAEDAAGLGRVASFAAMYGRSFTPPKPERLLTGGEVLSVGKLRFTVLHTPGHSPGGICLSGEGVVFTGDTLFNLSVGRSDFPGGSEAVLIDSIFSRLMVLPDETVVYPGHGPETTIGAERRGNPFLER